MRRWLIGSLGGLALALGSSASAQEQEPNNLCASAPDAGALVLPARIEGSLDALDATSRTDVDFARFLAEPGLRLRARVGGEAQVAVFSRCRLSTLENFRGVLDFTVPESGVFTLAVASRDDFVLSGFGTASPGSYTLQIEAQPPFIRAITGRVTDAATGLPLPGDTAQGPRLELRRCDAQRCQEPPLATSVVDRRGRFFIESRLETPIEAGAFRLTAQAADHASRSVDIEVGEARSLDVGDIALPLPEIELVDIQSCAEIPPNGGTCAYSVRILNRTASPLVGTAFSRVRTTLGFDPRASFEASTQPGDPGVQRAALAVDPFDGQVASFAFDVPSFVRNGTQICADVYVGGAPAPLLDVRASAELFCLQKGRFGFEQVTAQQAPVSELRASASEPTLERERNNSCEMAQDAGIATVETAVAGSLDARDATPRFTDVDFFRFTGEPGLRLSVDLSLDLNRRLLGLYDEGCALQALSPVESNGLDFDVPASGAFVLAVADGGDPLLDGSGGFNEGPYTLTFRPQTPFIGSITGRLVDAGSGRPLSGGARFPRLELTGCMDDGGCELVAQARADASGRFRLARSERGRRIPLFDSYFLDALAEEYRTESAVVRTEQDADLEVGDIALRPPALLFENVIPCAALPPTGGTCAYSVEIANNTATPIQGTAFSSVEADRGASTFFEATGEGGDADVVRPRVDIPGRGRATVRFAFEVLPTGRDQERKPLCVRLNLGYEPSPLFDPARSEPLFCLEQTEAGFEVRPGGSSQR